MVELLGLSLSLLLVLAGAALVIGEALAPGAHFIVLGVALLTAGLFGLLFGPLMGPFLPLVLAAIVLLAGAGALVVYRQFDFYGGAGEARTRDSNALRGETGRVTQRVSATSGQVKLEEGGFNPYYEARTIDGEISEGKEVVVVDPGGGNVLTVESVEGVDDIDRALARTREARAHEREGSEDAEPGGATGRSDGDEPDSEREREREEESV